MNDVFVIFSLSRIVLYRFQIPPVSMHNDNPLQSFFRFFFFHEAETH